MSLLGCLTLGSQCSAAETHLGDQAESTVPVGRFHTWWRDDALRPLSAMPGLIIAQNNDELLVADVTGIDHVKIESRMARGHQPWLASLAGDPVAWGWCASEEFSIGELGISRSLPFGNRYLWDFCTVPRYRGRGIYPRMLQAIIAREADAERFWLGHEMKNVASARGIGKAGFREVGILYRHRDGAFVLVPSGSLHVAEAASSLFGVAVADRRAARGV